MMNYDKITVTLPVSEFKEMEERMAVMQKALDNKSVVVARYFGHRYHIVNADEQTQLLAQKLNQIGGFDI